MTDCLDKHYQDMLMAYEMGLLSEEEDTQMERHLYLCDSCFSEVERFSDRIELLRHSPLLRKEMSETKKSTATTRKTFKLTRYMLAAAIVLAVSLPIYYTGLDSDLPPATQHLELVPVRGAGSNVVYLDQGGLVEIQFVMPKPFNKHEYIVTISSRSGEQVMTDSSFSDISDSGRGIIELSVSEFKPGYYTLTITDPSLTAGEPLRQYSFRVK